MESEGLQFRAPAQLMDDGGGTVCSSQTVGQTVGLKSRSAGVCFGKKTSNNTPANDQDHFFFRVGHTGGGGITVTSRVVHGSVFPPVKLSLVA